MPRRTHQLDVGGALDSIFGYEGSPDTWARDKQGNWQSERSLILPHTVYMSQVAVRAEVGLQDAYHDARLKACFGLGTYAKPPRKVRGRTLLICTNLETIGDDTPVRLYNDDAEGAMNGKYDLTCDGMLARGIAAAESDRVDSGEQLPQYLDVIAGIAEQMRAWRSIAR